MSSSHSQPERFEEIEALLQGRPADSGPRCVEFRRALVMLEDELRSEDLQSLDAEFGSHLETCGRCARLHESWLGLPQRLSAALSLGESPVDSVGFPGLPEDWTEMPLLQDPEAQAERGLVPVELPDRLRHVLAANAPQAPAELDERVAASRAWGLLGARRQSGEREFREQRGFWRASVAAAALVVTCLIVWQSQERITPQIEIVQVDRPFDLDFSGESPLRGLEGPGLEGPGLEGPGLEGPGLEGPGLEGAGERHNEGDRKGEDE
jgi:hypothetical protein